jgi:hypothetical protein
MADGRLVVSRRTLLKSVLGGIEIPFAMQNVWQLPEMVGTRLAMAPFSRLPML